MEKIYYSKIDLSKRWGVSRQTVSNWATRHKDFPKYKFKISNSTIPVYHIDDIIAYEQKHKIMGE